MGDRSAPYGFVKACILLENGPINSAGALLRCVSEYCACAFCVRVATWSRVRYSICIWVTIVHLLACFIFNLLKVIFRKRAPFVSRHNLSIHLNCDFIAQDIMNSEYLKFTALPKTIISSFRRVPLELLFYQFSSDSSCSWRL